MKCSIEKFIIIICIVLFVSVACSKQENQLTVISQTSAVPDTNTSHFELLILAVDTTNLAWWGKPDSSFMLGDSIPVEFGYTEPHKNRFEWWGDTTDTIAVIDSIPNIPEMWQGDTAYYTYIANMNRQLPIVIQMRIRAIGHDYPKIRNDISGWSELLVLRIIDKAKIPPRRVTRFNLIFRKLDN